MKDDDAFDTYGLTFFLGLLLGGGLVMLCHGTWLQVMGGGLVLASLFTVIHLVEKKN